MARRRMSPTISARLLVLRIERPSSWVRGGRGRIEGERTTNRPNVRDERTRRADPWVRCGERGRDWERSRAAAKHTQVNSSRQGEEPSSPPSLRLTSPYCSAGLPG